MQIQGKLLSVVKNRLTARVEADAMGGFLCESLNQVASVATFSCNLYCGCKVNIERKNAFLNDFKMNLYIWTDENMTKFKLCWIFNISILHKKSKFKLTNSFYYVRCTKWTSLNINKQTNIICRILFFGGKEV